MKPKLIGVMLSIIVAACWGWLPRQALAQLQITEVFPNPTTTGDKGEWVELRNSGEEPEDFRNWMLDGQRVDYSYVIEPGEVFIVTNNLQAFNAEFGVLFRAVQIPVSLRNSGDTLQLNSDAGAIQEVSYPSLDTSESWEINSEVCGDFGLSPQHSLGQVRLAACIPEVPPEQIDYSGKLRLNEVMNDPSGTDIGQEWVEILNTSAEILDLSQLQIFDSKGPIYSFESGQKLSPGKFLVLNLPGSKLNNCASNSCVEQVSLVNGETVIDSFIYADSKTGKSWSVKENGTWTLDFLVTKSAANKPRPKKPAAVKPEPIVPTVVTPTVKEIEAKPVYEYRISSWNPELSDLPAMENVFVPIWPGFVVSLVLSLMILGWEMGIYRRVYQWWFS